MTKRESKGGVPITLDEDLKPRLIAAAGERSLNDLAVAVLAERFNHQHQPSGAPGGSVDEAKLVVNLDMPLELRDAINDGLEAENRRRRNLGEAKLNRSAYLNEFLRSYLDACERAAAA